MISVTGNTAKQGLPAPETITSKLTSTEKRLEDILMTTRTIRDRLFGSMPRDAGVAENSTSHFDSLELIRSKLTQIEEELSDISTRL
jgi:hypothetical protein